MILVRGPGKYTVRTNDGDLTQVYVVSRRCSINLDPQFEPDVPVYPDPCASQQVLKLNDLEIASEAGDPRLQTFLKAVFHYHSVNAPGKAFS